MFRFGDVLKHTDEYVHMHRELTYIAERRLMFITDSESGVRTILLRSGVDEPYHSAGMSFWGADKEPESLFVLADG